jgi:hypothetical protein
MTYLSSLTASLCCLSELTVTVMTCVRTTAVRFVYAQDGIYAAEEVGKLFYPAIYNDS